MPRPKSADSNNIIKVDGKPITSVLKGELYPHATRYIGIMRQAWIALQTDGENSRRYLERKKVAQTIVESVPVNLRKVFNSHVAARGFPVDAS